MTILSKCLKIAHAHRRKRGEGGMMIRFEFISDETGSTETCIVDADRIEQRNGWIVALKGESVVFATNEKYIKYVWLCE